MLIRVTAVMMALAAFAAGACGDLATLKLENATVTSAQVVAAGSFSLGRGGKGPNPYAGLPAFCRVQVTLTPSADSDIKVEVWLPVAGWNNKYLAVGNGDARFRQQFSQLVATVGDGLDFVV